MINFKVPEPPDFARALVDAAQPELRRRGQLAADAMQDASRALNFPSRPESRRRNPGSLRTNESFYGRVQRRGTRISVELVLKPGADRTKIMVLNYGSARHEIPGSLGIPTTGKRRPSPGLFSPQTNQQGGNVQRFTTVKHPGTKALRFLERIEQIGIRAVRQ